MMGDGLDITGGFNHLNDASQQAWDKTAIVVITDPEGRITYANDNFCTLSQYSLHEVIGKDYFLLLSEHQDNSIFKRRWDRIRSGEVWSGKMKNKKRSGDFFWTQSTIGPILDETERPHQYLCFGLDITGQKIKEQGLAKSNPILRAVTNSFPDATVSLVDTDLNILFVGGSGYKTPGLSSEELIGKPLKSFVSLSTYESVEKALPRILQGETVFCEMKTDGGYFSHSYAPVYDEEGILYCFIIVTTDISKRRRDTFALKRKNEMLAIGEELAGIGSWESFGATMEIYFSSNTLKLLGRDTSRNRWSFEEILQWIHPEDMENVFKSFQVMVDQNISGIQEFRIVKPDGEERLLQSFSKMDSCEEGVEFRKFGVVIDITEKRKKEQELVESREILRNIADSIPGLVMRYVELENKKSDIHYVSKGAEQLWGISHEKIMADVDIVWKSVHPEDRPGFLQSFRSSRETGSVWECEFRILMDNGKIKWISAIGTPNRVLEEQIRWDILALDITDKKVAEEKIVKNLEVMTLQNTQLMDFCNIVSHNLRSPLVNLAMLISFVQEAEEEEERQIYLEKLKPVIDGLKETFDELVESIQIQQDHKLKSEKLAIGDCFKKVMRGFEGQIAKTRATIETDFSEAPFLHYPPKYLINILHNLLSNALKYSSPERDLKLIVKAKRVHHKVILSFKDNGLGIDLERYGKKIFRIREIFHRHPDAKGFGLYITRTQLEAMKDKIWVESIPDEGSTFFVEFNNQ